LVLSAAVLAERIDGRRGDVHAACLSRLGFCEDETMTDDASHALTHLDDASFQIHVPPVETQKLALPHAGGKRQRVDRLEAVASGRG
jgi:hypothetical protein